MKIFINALIMLIYLSMMCFTVMALSDICIALNEGSTKTASFHIKASVPNLTVTIMVLVGELAVVVYSINSIVKELFRNKTFKHKTDIH